MSITKIRVYSHIDLFGREATARDVELYNEWLEGKLGAEYPGTVIEARNEQSLTRADVFVNGERDACSKETDEVERLLQYCWDTCPWDFM